MSIKQVQIIEQKIYFLRPLNEKNRKRAFYTHPARPLINIKFENISSLFTGGRTRRETYFRINLQSNERPLERISRTNVTSNKYI